MKRKFNPFDRVLVRDYEHGTWSPAIFMRYNDNPRRCYPYVMLNQQQNAYCIPYEGNEHLCFTSGDPTPSAARGADLQVRYKRLQPEAVAPSYAHPTDAGLDLTATTKRYDEWGNVVYGTGLAFEIPEGYVGLVFPRSSNSRRSLLLSNSVGVIDSGYRGEVTVAFRKDYQVRGHIPFTDVFGNEDYIKDFYHNEQGEYSVGDRVAQLIIVPYPRVGLIEADELSTTERGEGGYGSTGN